MASLTKIQPLSSVLPVAHPSCHPLLCSSVPPIVFSFRIQLHLSHNHCFCSPSFCSSAAHFCCSLCIYAGALRGVWLVCSAPLWMGCVYKSGSAPFLASTVSSDGSSAITAHFIKYHSNFSSDFYSSASFLCPFILTELLSCQIRKQSTFDQESKVKLNPKPRPEMPRVDLWWPLSYFS